MHHPITADHFTLPYFACWLPACWQKEAAVQDTTQNTTIKNNVKSFVPLSAVAQNLTLITLMSQNERAIVSLM